MNFTEKQNFTPRIILSTFTRKAIIVSWILLKLALVAIMTNDAPGDFIYSGF